MTTDVAKQPGVEKECGAIAAGMAADPIAVDENPLEKIDTLKSVRMVMRGGRLLRVRSRECR